jgi:peptidoglycan/LPS O-acetylase OafA/YrhL
LNIICFHAYGYRGHLEFHLGGLWTQFFFVLAGFVLAYVEMARPAAKAAQQMTTLQYIKKRLITIYPLYAMSLLLYVLVPKKDDMCKWGTLPLHVLLLQAIVQVPECGAPYTYWNGVAWFLSALVVYWAMLRPLSRHFRTVSLRSCCLWLLGLWLVSLALVPTLQLWHNERGANTWLSHGPLGYVHVFVAGVATARIFILTCTKDVATGLAPEADFSKIALATERAPFFLRWGCVTGYGLYAALLALWWHLGATGFMDREIVWAPADSMERSLYLVLHNGGILPIMVLILAGGAAGVDPIARAFRNPLFQGLAKISYAQYVLQSPVSKMLRQTGMPISTFKICYLPVLIICAFVAQRLVEKPYADWLRQADAKPVTTATRK